MTSPPAVEPLSPEATASLADFARTCKAAARAVLLYPEIHPAIQSSLARVITAAGRLASGGDLALTVLPDQLVIGGRAPARVDAAVGELAALLHERLIASLTVKSAASPQEWRSLLLLLGRATEDLIAEGGIAKVLARSGAPHMAVREIDYADVLRERGGGNVVAWDQIIRNCMLGEQLDETQLEQLLDIFNDPSRLTEFLSRLEGTEGSGGPSVSERAAALLNLVQQLLEAVHEPSEKDRLLETMALGVARLTPDMLLALFAQAQSGEVEQRAVAAIVSRMSDETVASFVVKSVAAEGGASARLAQAFQVLVPDSESRTRILDLAHETAGHSPLAEEGHFEELWQSAAEMLTSYSDQTYVSGEYGQQLSSARARAVEVERISDDPPERLRDWKETVSDAAIRELDLSLLLDLLRLEESVELWQPTAGAALADIGRRVAAGDIGGAMLLTEAVTALAGADGDPRQTAAQTIVAQLADGPLARELIGHLQRAADTESLEDVARLCTAIGARMVRPLAEALVEENNPRTIRRLRDLLLGFGPAGRDAVERLQQSPNPAVRRLAVELLRMFGGSDALPELTRLLADADEQVQREAVRGLVHIGTEAASAVVERAIAAGGASGDTVLQQLIGLRDDRAAPLFSYVLTHSEPRGRMAAVHERLIDALGALRPHSESAPALKAALYRGDWWAPLRTAALRRAAAAALKRLNSPEARAILDEAASSGSAGVRKAARAHAAGRPRA